MMNDRLQKLLDGFDTNRFEFLEDGSVVAEYSDGSILCIEWNDTSKEWYIVSDANVDYNAKYSYACGYHD